jgi:toxin ParE1/3/4
MPKKPKRLIWSPRAEQDLQEIWRYLAAEASLPTADKLIRQVIHAAERIGDRPLSGRARDDLTPGLRAVLSHPYVVFYRVVEDDVQVVRVLHERRDIATALSKPE